MDMGIIGDLWDIVDRLWFLNTRVVWSPVKDISISAFWEFCKSSLRCRKHEELVLKVLL